MKSFDQPPADCSMRARECPAEKGIQRYHPPAAGGSIGWLGGGESALPRPTWQKGYRQNNRDKTSPAEPNPRWW